MDKILGRLERNDKIKYEAIIRKCPLLLTHPHHFKNLRAPLQHLKRVHIDGHFVLLFSVDESAKTVTLEGFEHHDRAYKR
jgi:mRNA-degrading endonuclease RelE of RelBE toxin-antitoxin system